MPPATSSTTEPTPPGLVPRGHSKPGVHSYNRRRVKSSGPSQPVVRGLRVLFLLAGLAGVGYYGYVLADQYIYQAYGNWAFDQTIAGRHVTFADYLRSETPLSHLAPAPPRAPTIAKAPSPAPGPGVVAPPRPVNGDLLGKLVVSRLNISAIVREGVDDDTLRRAVGHVPSTALPGETGNFSIAAHRDTLFRALKDIRKDDRVTFQADNHTFVYQVVSTRIVKPTDVSVLDAEQDQKLLTMITCYPFYFVGSAPERFIVKARLVEDQPETVAAPVTPPVAKPVEKPPPAKPVARVHATSIASASTHRPRQSRGFSRSQSNVLLAGNNSPTPPRRRPGLWRKLVSVLTRRSD